ncbi:MAG: nodulation protein NfeD [Dehalococcoidales bacterium]|nr:nodulation protein NfeD [Dehalococcoidales bacterium]
MPKLLRLLPVLVLLLVASSAIYAQEDNPTIDVLHIKGVINPVLTNYIDRGIQESENSDAVALIIQMDTPGGLDNAMRDIIQLIDKAQVPVVVYIPPGARAASAGFFITIAADIAVMAPDTAIGAATPVSIGTEGEVQTSEEMQAKVTNDAVAYAKAIANSHGRNVEWAEKAVREAASVPAYEALELNVIDLVATDISSLISQLNGFEITITDGSTFILKTQGAIIKDIKMSTIEAFLFAITDPNIAYILLSLAILGITVEIFNPGLIFPGVVGAIAGLMAFYSLGMLPVNYAGVLLMILALVLFIAEAFTTTFGLLTAGGIASLVIGSLILFPGGDPMFQIDPWLIVTVAIFFTVLFVFIVNRVVAAHRHQATTGREELLGKTANVRTALKPEGTVFHEGEIWTALLDKGQAEPGEEVLISKIDGLKLYVTKK